MESINNDVILGQASDGVQRLSNFAAIVLQPSTDPRASRHWVIEFMKDAVQYPECCRRA